MKICPQCGVELDDDLPACPLCKTSAQPTGRIENNTDYFNQPRELLSDFHALSRIQKRKLFWELSGIILLSGILVTLIIDVLTTQRITWSRYTVTICKVIFANFTLFSFLRHKLLIMLVGSFGSTSLLLVLLDMYNQKIGWGSQLGIPLLLAFYLIVIILTILVKKARHLGLNILGFFFLATGLYAMCVEIIVSGYIHGHIMLRWGLIVFVSVIPIAAILFFIHYKLRKGIELKRFFHI